MRWTSRNYGGHDEKVTRLLFGYAKKPSVTLACVDAVVNRQPRCKCEGLFPEAHFTEYLTS